MTNLNQSKSLGESTVFYVFIQLLTVQLVWCENY